MKLKYIEPMAMFMICLILTLPIYISSVYADINSVTSYGKEGITNFVSQQYDLTVQADVSLPGKQVTPDLVKLKKSSELYTYFDSCSKTSNTSSLCTVNIIRGVNSEAELCPQTNFNVELYEYKDALPVYTKTLTVKCDAQAPSISMSISSVSKTSSPTLSYSLQDPDNSETKCSGIGKIEFYLNSLSAGAAVLTPNTSGCSYSSTTSIDTSAYPDGDYVVYIKAYDKIGNSNVANASFKVDKTAPIGSASVLIKDLSGNIINYFTPQNVLADISVNIEDLSGVSTYKLNYSSLTSTAPACSADGTNVICTWSNLQIYMANSSFTKTIGLQATDILGNNASSSIIVTGEITPDTTPPAITISDITIGTTDGTSLEWYRPGNMRMSFSANISEEMSGISSISGDFSNINVISGDIPTCTGSGNYYSCTWSNLIFYMDAAAYSKEIRVIAKDNAGNEGTASKTASKTYKADTSAPALSNFKILKSDGNNITGWIGNKDIFAKVSVDVSEKGAGLESVNANFYNLNPAYTSYQVGTCTQTSGSTAATTSTETGIYKTYTGNATNTTYLPEYTYTCEWSLTIHFNTSGNPYNAQIGINATDKSLNNLPMSFSQAYQVDLDAPVISSLTTDHSFNSIYYVGADPNTFIVGITDSGVGINNSNIYLDLTGIGFDSNHKVDSCSGGYCYLYMPGCESITEGVHTISVNTNTMDDLGNKLSSPFYANVTADLTRPSLNSINVTPVAATTELYMDYFLTGNALYVVANITEATSIASAYGDFSNFISGADNVLADSCERQSGDNDTQSDYWTCIWATDAMDITSYKKDNIYLNFTDVAGNTYSYTYNLEVLEAMTGNVSYWTPETGDPSPSAIDRQIVTFYSPSMWFPASLVSTEGLSASSRWPLEVSVESCEGDLTSSNDSNTSSSTSAVNYLSSANSNMPLLVNPNTETPTSLPYNMYMDYELEQSAPTEDSINITCTLKIRTLVDQQKISPYEYKNITVIINYYNNPLGTLDSNIQDEIDAVKDGWLIKAEWIGTINNILEIARMLCGLVQNLYQLTKIIGALHDVWASDVNPYTKAYTEAMAIVTGKTASAFGAVTEGTWTSYVDKFCKFLNCQLYYGKDWGDEASSGTFAKWGRFASQYSQYWSPRDSIVMSIIFLCLPGILYNLQKARVIDCQYINCLKSTAYGMPLQMCVKQRDYSWCKYVFGELFNMVPFAAAISQLAQKIKSMLSQPAEMIGVGLKYLCQKQCLTHPTCTACIALEGISLLLDVLCDLGMGSDQCTPFWEDLKVDDSVCDSALE